MSKSKSMPKTINGYDVDDFFGEVIGPMAASVLQAFLYRAVQNNGEDLTGPELKMVQFAIERSYGAAKRQVEVTRATVEEIEVAKLKDLDHETLRRIASSNGRRDNTGDDDADD